MMKLNSEYNISIYIVYVLTLRAAQAHAPPGCEDQMEFSVFDDGEILRTVSCYPSCSHRPTDKKAHGEGKVIDIFF